MQNTNTIFCDSPCPNLTFPSPTIYLSKRGKKKKTCKFIIDESQIVEREVYDD